LAHHGSLLFSITLSRFIFTDRNKVIREARVNPTCIVFEVGAGNGFLTETLAESEILNLYKIALNTIYDD
jgi:hypothetical protein